MASTTAPRPVQVPPELHGVPPNSLEDYVQVRLGQFGAALVRRLDPNVHEGDVARLTAEVAAELPLPEYPGARANGREYQLVFRHDCLSLGCLDAQCVLCEHNPHRRCSVNFAPKYLVNDVLKARCDAPIRVEVIDRHTGAPAGDDVADCMLEMCILDGNQYDARCVEAGEERRADLEACSLLLNNKAQPLLLGGTGVGHSSSFHVLVPLGRDGAVLPDLHVSDSSEAMLSGRKPPFRLLVRATFGGAGPHPRVRHAVSEGFVVATRRTRTAGKVDIPNVDDHISKLDHMGKETVKKLQDLRGSGVAAGIDLAVPCNAVNRVGEFRRLALLAEADGHLRQKLQQVLKLSKEKWEEARDHALKAVVADNRMRIWYADAGSMELGLLYTCRLGNVDLDRPVGLLTKRGQDGAQTTMDATLMAQQTPAQRDQVRALQPLAVAAWWRAGHPGWAIYPADSERFLATGSLDTMAPAAAPGAPAEHIVAPLPSVGPGYPPASVPPPQGYAPPPRGAPLFAGGGGGGVVPGPPIGGPTAHTLHSSHVGPSGLLGGTYPLHLAATPAGADPDASPRGMAPSMFAMAPNLDLSGSQDGGGRSTSTSGGGGGMATLGGMAPSVTGGGTGRSPRSALNGGSAPVGHRTARGGADDDADGDTGPSPFALLLAQQSGGERGAEGLGVAPSFNLASLQGLFGGDLSKIPGLATGLSLGHFPSVPGGMLSGELEQLLAHAGGADAFVGATHAPSLGGMVKLGSLDLPDAVTGGGGAASHGPRTGSAASGALPKQGYAPDPGAQASTDGTGPTAAAGQTPGPGLPRNDSGLDNMASIEAALADVKSSGRRSAAAGAHAVMEAAAQEYVRQQLTGHKRQSSRPLP